MALVLFKVKAQYDFFGAEQDELHFKAGDILEVLSLEDDPWWLCLHKSKGIKGLAPNNYLLRFDGVSVPNLSVDTNQNNGNPSDHYHSSKEPVSSDMQRLARLRKEADAKIEALKYAIERSEHQKPTTSHSQAPTSPHTLPLSRASDGLFPIHNSNPTSPTRVSAIVGTSTSSNPSNEIPITPQLNIPSAQESIYNEATPKLKDRVSDKTNLPLIKSTKEKKGLVMKSPDCGFRYSPCRSIVYYPSNLISSTEMTHPPEADMKLHHVYAYDGDLSKHGGTVRGKNIMWLLDGRLIYPAASLVVILDIEVNSQWHFRGHSGDITALTVHAEKGLAASAEQGKVCRVLIWDLSIIDTPDNISTVVNVDVTTILGLRMVSGLNFSADCKYLVVLGIADRNILIILDVLSGEQLASARLGHSEIMQMGFNPFLYTPSPIDTGQKTQIADGTDRSKTSCYSLVSCGGKQVKFWTLCEVNERIDIEGIVTHPDASDQFKGRRLIIPKKKQQWLKKYVLEGNQVLNSDSPDMTCFCPIFDGKIGNFIKSRVFTGTSVGSVYIWEQLEESTDWVCWQPRGRLLSIVTNVHSSPIIDLDYSGPASYDVNDEDIDEEWVERIVSTCHNGVINTWRVNRSNEKNTPFIQEVCLGLSLADDIGQPRCVSFNLECNAVVVGTTGNSICMLSGLEVSVGSQINEANITLGHLVCGHSSKVRKVVCHPSANIFVTISADKTIRLWDGFKKSQISCGKIVGRGTSVSFSHDGSHIAVGNESGELIILTHVQINSDVPLLSARSLHSNPDGWHVILRRTLSSNTHIAPKKEEIKNGRDKKRGVSLTNSFHPNEVTCITYSPTGEVIAAGCRDKLIHILSVDNGYKRTALCKGHGTYVTNIDFSLNGLFLQSNDAAREILFWDVKSGKSIGQSTKCRDISWASWRCVYGWPCQGVYNGEDGSIEDADINAVARSHDGKLLVCGGSNTIGSSVKLYRFPTFAQSVPLIFGGHTSPCLDITFSADDRFVYSVGGNDMCIFQWDVLRPSNAKP